MSLPQMKLAMTLLVRDNIELIEHHLNYHIAQGIDHFVITDNGSIDGTRELLENFREQASIIVFDEPKDDYSQSLWVNRMVRYAHEELKADWIINSDADEFWWPLSGDLKSVFASVEPCFGSVIVNRTNFLPALMPIKPFWQNMIYREVISKNSMGQPLPPKIAHRSANDVVVAMGNHQIESATLGPPFCEQPILIFHFPYLSFEQFENKIRLGGRALASNVILDKGAGGTWRELYRLYLQGDLRQWYNKLSKIETDADRMISQGEVVQDLRLRNFFEVSAAKSNVTTVAMSDNRPNFAPRAILKAGNNG